jgi:hypothetical protein
MKRVVMFLNRVMDQYAVQWIVLGLIVLGVTINTVVALVTMEGDFADKKQQLALFEDWDNGKAAFMGQSNALQRQITSLGKDIYAFNNKNLLYANLFIQSEKLNLTVADWQEKKTRRKELQAHVDIDVQQTGRLDAFLNFVQQLERLGNPVQIKKLRVYKAKRSRQIHFDYTMSVVFKI